MTDRRSPGVPSRREFCTQACHIASIAVIGGVLGGCGASPTAPDGRGDALPTMTGTIGDRTVTVAVDGGSPLASIGKPALVQTAAESYLVTRTNHDTFIALTAQCTHYICLVKNFSGSVYVCPCHGSQFDISGQVKHGPATQPLRQFQTRFDGNTLTISL